MASSNWISPMADCVCGRTTEPKLARSKPTKSCALAVLTSVRRPIAVAMIQCVNLKIPSPLFQIKYKTAFKRESIAMFNAALAIGI